MSQEELTVIIDVPRGSFVKRSDELELEFVSPLPCPFNYGHVPGTVAGDGAAEDAVVLGRRLPLGSSTTVRRQARVDFLDAGVPDPKWVCSAAPLSRFDRLKVSGFFRIYALAKGVINRVQGKTGPTRYRGWL